MAWPYYMDMRLRPEWHWQWRDLLNNIRYRDLIFQMLLSIQAYFLSLSIRIQVQGPIDSVSTQSNRIALGCRKMRPRCPLSRGGGGGGLCGDIHEHRFIAVFCKCRPEVLQRSGLTDEQGTLPVHTFVHCILNQGCFPALGTKEYLSRVTL